MKCALQKREIDVAGSECESEVCKYLEWDHVSQRQYSQALQNPGKPTSAHHPLPILADTDTLAGFFKLEIL